MKNDYRIKGNVVWITLTQGKRTRFELKNLSRVSQHRWCARKTKGKFYAVTRIGRRLVGLHSLLLSVARVDHKNGDGLDNLEGNLRESDAATNGQNRGKQSNNTSGFKGVTWNKHSESWMSQIQCKKVKRTLGYFSSKRKAALAYDKAARSLFGEFAQLNFLSLTE